MFSWFKAKEKKATGEYHPAERAIYPFYNGVKLVKVDPLPLYKAVMSKGAELSVDMKVSLSPMKDNVKAHNNLVKSIREIFSVKSFEEGGLTETETIDLLSDFLDWCDSVKKNLNPIQTTPVETLPPTKPILEDAQPTKNGLASGPTETGLLSGELER